MPLDPCYFPVMQIKPSEIEKTTERFERAAEARPLNQSGLAPEEVDRLIKICQGDPGAYFVMSKHSSQSAASSRIGQMKKTRKWAESGLIFKSRRIDEEDAQGAILACWPTNRVTETGRYYLKLGEASDEEIRALIERLKTKQDWAIPTRLVHIDSETITESGDDNWTK